jgi:hypothetical protein
MYIEYKGNGLVGPARIGRVTYSKTRKSLTYRGKEFGSLKGTGFKANYAEVESGEQYWISGCKKDGLDSLYPNLVEIDNDVREEYWVEIRNKPELKDTSSFRCLGKYSK